MAETDWHRILMTALIQTLDAWYGKNKKIYVSGNLLIFYEQGNRRKHVSPDVFVVKGVAKHLRPNYLMWQEKKAPDVVIELTSSSTRREDLKKKFDLYQHVLKVQEYFLFDPRGDYLKPPLRGYRLLRGKYEPIEAVHGRLPSQVLDLHLERAGEDLRLFEPSTSRWLPTPEEAIHQVQAENRRLRRVLQQRRPRPRNRS